MGREGPIVQIGSAVGSVAGQAFKLHARHIKVLVAAGAAAGISATFNAPLAGVVFSSEIILGSFAVESLTPIIVAAVLADVVQRHVGEHGLNHAFQQLDYQFGDWNQLPAYFALGLLCGIAAVGFTKLVYATEDKAKRWLPRWWMRALVLGSWWVFYTRASLSQSPQQLNTTSIMVASPFLRFLALDMTSWNIPCIWNEQVRKTRQMPPTRASNKTLTKPSD